MNKTMMLIVNPGAGKGGFRACMGKVMEILCTRFAVTVYFTTGRGHASQLAAEHGGKYDIVACMGGDGTLSEVVAGLITLQNPPVIGYIPLGTANDVASTLKLPKVPAEAAARIIEGHPTALDVGAFNSADFFTYIAAFGAFTEVSYETPQENKHALGHLAYLLEGMARLPKLTHYNVIIEHDGGILTEDLAFGAVTNSTSVAGLVRLDGSAVDLCDGQFEVLLIRNPVKVSDMHQIVTEILSRNFSGSGVISLKSSRVRFHFDQPVAWTRDGENGGRHREVDITNRHAAVSIIV